MIEQTYMLLHVCLCFAGSHRRRDCRYYLRGQTAMIEVIIFVSIGGAVNDRQGCIGWRSTIAGGALERGAYCRMSFVQFILSQ